MLERLKSFFGGLEPRASDAAVLTADDPRVAAAALMFLVIDADGVRDEAERAKLRQALSRAHRLEGTELERVIDAGEEAERQAVDLFSFTSILNRRLDADAKIEFVGILWETVYADGDRHELEDNLVSRIAELIGVSPRDRVLARQRVTGAPATDETDEGEDQA